MHAYLASAKNALLLYYLPRRVFSHRWLLAIPFTTLLIVYIIFETLATNPTQVPPTIWEMLISVLNYPQILHHGLLNMLIYLVSGIGFVAPFEIQLLFRIRSRQHWFRVQLVSVLAAVAAYMGLILLLTLIISLPVAPWSLQWGGFSHALLRQSGLSETLLALPPLQTAAFMIILMGMAWVFISISVVLLTTLTQRPTLGFLGGVALNYSMLIIAQSDAGWLQRIWPSHYLFLWKAAMVTGTPTVEFVISCLYWLLLIAIGLAFFRKQTQMLNFMDKREADSGS